MAFILEAEPGWLVGSAHQYGSRFCISSGSSHLQFLFAALLFDDDYYYHCFKQFNLLKFLGEKNPTFFILAS